MMYLVTMLMCLLYGEMSAYKWVDGPVAKDHLEDLHCPGLYCGRVEEEDQYSECGKCPRGWRVSKSNWKISNTSASHSICFECTDSPLLYDWLFLAFHGVLVLVLHWMAIDLTAKRQKLTKAVLVLHTIAMIEVVLAAGLTLGLTHPLGSLDIHACRVDRLSDWYTYFHNPTPNYETTLNCTQEAVYPFYSMIFVFYGLCGLSMLIIRPYFVAKLLPRRGNSSIFAALYFLPMLALVQAVAGGLVYESFPYIVVILSLISSAFHFAFKLNQSALALLLGCVRDSRSAIILLGHWLLHAFGILAITQVKDPGSIYPHLPLLLMVPVPALFYIVTVRFSNPENFIPPSSSGN